MVHTILDAIKDTRVSGREKPGVRWPRSRLGHGAAVTVEATVPRTELIVAVQSNWESAAARLCASIALVGERGVW